jgi:hypothetical protein
MGQVDPVTGTAGTGPRAHRSPLTSRLLRWPVPSWREGQFEGMASDYAAWRTMTFAADCERDQSEAQVTLERIKDWHVHTVARGA